VRVRPVELPNTVAPKPRDPVVARVMPPGPEPVLDPFEIGGRNLDILRQELNALNRPRLINIIAAYDLNPGGDEISWMSDRQLVHFIVTAVETQMAMRSRGTASSIALVRAGYVFRMLERCSFITCRCLFTV
jgi:hypothetical protein